MPALKAYNRMMRRLVGIGYKYQFEAEWRIDPTPEWYDHLIHLTAWSRDWQPQSSESQVRVWQRRAFS